MGVVAINIQNTTIIKPVILTSFCTSYIITAVKIVVLKLIYLMHLIHQVIKLNLLAKVSSNSKNTNEFNT